MLQCSYMEKINFEIVINKDVQTVWHKMLDIESYKEWTKTFEPTSFYEGSFTEGSDIKFMSSNRSGMVGFIKEARLYEFISIEFTGFLKDGEKDLDIPGAKEVIGTHENYSFEKISEEETKVFVEMDMHPEYKAMMSAAWPKALLKLKEICETI